MRRLLATTIATVCLFAMASQPAGAAAAEDEAGLVAGINAIRTSRGLHPLEVHPDLQSKAWAWAAQMAGTGVLAHSSLSQGITVEWASLAENVAMGDSLDLTEQTLLSSPVHFANLVDPDLSHVGVGLASAGGRVYLAQEFMQLRTPAVATASATTTPPTMVTTTPAPAEPRVARSPAPALAASPAPPEAVRAASPTAAALPVVEAPSAALPVVEAQSATPTGAVTSPAVLDLASVALPAPLITPVTHNAKLPAPTGADRSRAGSLWISVALLLLVTGNLGLRRGSRSQGHEDTDVPARL